MQGAEVAASLRIWLSAGEPQDVIDALDLDAEDVTFYDHRPDGGRLVVWRPEVGFDAVSETLDPITDLLDEHHATLRQITADGIQLFLGMGGVSHAPAAEVLIPHRYWQSLATAGASVMFDPYPPWSPVELPDGDDRKWAAVRAGRGAPVAPDEFAVHDSESIYDNVIAELDKAIDQAVARGINHVEVAFTSANGQGGFRFDAPQVARLAAAGLSVVVSLHRPPLT